MINYIEKAFLGRCGNRLAYFIGASVMNNKGVMALTTGCQGRPFQAGCHPEDEAAASRSRHHEKSG